MRAAMWHGIGILNAGVAQLKRWQHSGMKTTGQQRSGVALRMAYRVIIVCGVSIISAAAAYVALGSSGIKSGGCSWRKARE